MPKRLQRKRTKGWRKPEGSVIVDRTSRWGNPFKLQGDMIYCDASHRRTVLDPWVILCREWGGDPITPKKGQEYDTLIRLYFEWILGNDFEGIVRPCPFTLREIVRELRGKDLLCFCSTDHWCHGDILLHVANAHEITIRILQEADFSNQKHITLALSELLIEPELQDMI